MSETKYVGLGLLELLTILFVALKLTGQIDWSWLWVLSPMWIFLSPILIWIVILILGTLINKIIN